MTTTNAGALSIGGRRGGWGGGAARRPLGPTAGRGSRATPTTSAAKRRARDDGSRVRRRERGTSGTGEACEQSLWRRGLGVKFDEDQRTAPEHRASEVANEAYPPRETTTDGRHPSHVHARHGHGAEECHIAPTLVEERPGSEGSTQTRPGAVSRRYRRGEERRLLTSRFQRTQVSASTPRRARRPRGHRKRGLGPPPVMTMARASAIRAFGGPRERIGCDVRRSSRGSSSCDVRGS